MKKLLALGLTIALMLLFVLSLAMAESPAPETALTGDWFGETQGMILQLTLKEDGSYTAAFPAREGSEAAGTWEFRDGFLYLDGSDVPAVNVLGEDVLKWTELDTFLRREVPLVYTPAEPAADVPADVYNGTWKALYVSAEGAMLMADTLGEPTGAYIEGTNVALTGPLTGEAVLEMTFAEGGLRWTQGDAEITLQLQQDGILRMTLGDVKVYLMLLVADAPDVPAAAE